MRYPFVGLIAWTILISPALGQGEPWGRHTPEEWAWSQIVHGKVADFNDRCGPMIFPDGEDASCREVNSIAIEKMLTDHVLTDQIPHQGVNLKNAIVIGDQLDLSNSQ